MILFDNLLIMSDNFHTLRKTVNPLVQEVQSPADAKHIIIKMFKMSDKEKTKIKQLEKRCYIQ